MAEPFIWLNFMCEGSLLKRRALVVVQTRARLKNTEGSDFQLILYLGASQSKERFSRIKGGRLQKAKVSASKSAKQLMPTA